MPRQVLVISPTAAMRASWLIDTATRRGMVLGGPATDGERYYYGGPKYAAVHATALGVSLLEPDDDWLCSLDTTLIGRQIQMMTLAEARTVGRAFIKPPSSKEFVGRVYADADDLHSATRDLPDDTVVQVSDVVEFASEYRFFLLDGRIHAGSRYATWGNLDPSPLGASEAERVADEVQAKLDMHAHTLPSAVVVDAGVCGPPDDPRRDVVFVEANMAWFANPYMADPDRVLDVVLRAAGPADKVRETDQRFVRQVPGQPRR